MHLVEPGVIICSIRIKFATGSTFQKEKFVQISQFLSAVESFAVVLSGRMEGLVYYNTPLDSVGE